METKVGHENGRREQPLMRDIPSLRLQKPALRNAFRLCVAIAILMVIASAAGLLIDGLYTDGAWAREALRGGDLTTLAVAVPVLIGSLVLARRGSQAAQAVWLGVLAYSVYNYAYFAFGAEFNDIFVLHIALFSLSIITLVLAVANVDVDAIAARFRGVSGTRWIGGFLVVVSDPGRALGVPRNPVRDHR